jgi:hypothetical protein
VPAVHLLVLVAACAPRPAHRAIVPGGDAAALARFEDAGGTEAGGGRGGAADAAGGTAGGADAAPFAPTPMDATLDAPATHAAAPDAAAPDAPAEDSADSAVAGGSAGIDLTAGLAHRWRFDEGMGSVAADSSGAGNLGTLMGGPAWVSPGAFPGSPFALSFDGTNAYVATMHDLAPVLGATASLACWIKTTHKGADNSFDAPGITGVEMNGGSDDIFWGFLDANGNLGLRPGGGSTVKSAAPINDNVWHHVVMIRDATSRRLQIFVDGKPSKAADGQEAGPKTSMFAAIGRISNSSKPYFKGQLDDVRIWNRVLSAAEVTALFASF